MAIHLPDPAFTAARWDLKGACATLDEAAIQAVVHRHSGVLEAHCGAQSVVWDAAKAHLLSGVDLRGIGIPDSRVDEMRAGLTLQAIMHEVLPSGYVAAGLLGLPLDSTVWPAFWEERPGWKRKAPTSWDADLLENPTGVALGSKSLADLSGDARLLLALADSIVKQKTADPSAFWVKPNLNIETVFFPALRELEALGFARGSDPPDRLKLLTAVQLKATFPECSEAGTAKSSLVDAVVRAVPDEQILGRLAAFPDAASPYLLTIGLNLGKDADWLLAFSSLLADWITHRADMVQTVQQTLENGGTPGGWHVIVADRCRTCSSKPNNIAESDVPLLPPFHIGCHCTVIADGRYGVSEEVLTMMRRKPRKTATKKRATGASAPKKAPAKKLATSTSAAPRPKPAAKRASKKRKKKSILGTLLGDTMKGIGKATKSTPVRKPPEKKAWHYY
jgi:hypothetical protein